MTFFIEKIKIHSKEIEDWYNSSISLEETDFIHLSLRIKIIKNPIYIRQDLLTLDFFNDLQIRSIAIIDFYPGIVVTHNHKNNSYHVYDSIKNEYSFFPVEKNISYKTTHFTIHSNKNAYLLYGNKKIFWERGVFNELNVLDVDHSAYNGGETPIKFIYFDYYE
jgi:hypothetical protein